MEEISRRKRGNASIPPYPTLFWEVDMFIFKCIYRLTFSHTHTLSLSLSLSLSLARSLAIFYPYIYLSTFSYHLYLSIFLSIYLTIYQFFNIYLCILSLPLIQTLFFSSHHSIVIYPSIYFAPLLYITFPSLRLFVHPTNHLYIFNFPSFHPGPCFLNKLQG